MNIENTNLNESKTGMILNEKEKNQQPHLTLKVKKFSRKPQTNFENVQEDTK